MWKIPYTHKTISTIESVDACLVEVSLVGDPVTELLDDDITEVAGGVLAGGVATPVVPAIAVVVSGSVVIGGVGEAVVITLTLVLGVVGAIVVLVIQG